MSALHPLLRRQLRRIALAEDAPPPTAEAWTAFLERVSRWYRDADEDRYTTERALAISSREMQELYEQLRRSSEDELAQGRCRLAHNRALLHAALETIDDGVLVVGDDRRVVAYNSRFSQLWRIPAELLEAGQDEALLGYVLSSLANPDEFLARVIYLYEHPDENSRDEVRLADGRIFDRYSAPVVVDAQPRGRLWVFREVTEQRRADVELRHQKDVAERASRAKSDFLANMSHELRTPLNAIVGFARVLFRGQFDAADPRQREYVDHILRSGEHMLALVNDLLDLRRIEEDRHGLEIGAHPVSSLVDAALSMIRPLVDQRQHALAIELPDGLPPVACDPRAIVQVLVNLLSNAAKYTDPGGHLVLRARPDAEWTSFEVEDDGIGIAPEDQAKLFTYFTQVGAKHEHHMHGSGVGLALTRALVERMGGTIDVSSKPGHGSVFRFRLRNQAGSVGQESSWPPSS